MAVNYRGLYLIGERESGRITHVQVVDTAGSSFVLPLVEYIDRGVEPVAYGTLPWRGAYGASPRLDFDSLP
jgi:hypothetical protein